MNNRIKMAVVGLRFGEYVADCQIGAGPGSPYIELGGVFDLDKKKSERVSLNHNVREYGALDEILADPSIEAVGLFTPPGGRAGLIRKIIRAGKHVMTTKPFELNAEDALAVMKEARILGVTIHQNSPEPLPDSETAQILKWKQEFQLGSPVAVRWETYTRYHEQADGGWYDDPEQCPVAPVFRLGIYGINQLLRLCGRVSAVSVAHSRLFTGRPTADNGELSLQFLNGALGSVFASFCIDDGHRYANTLNIHYEHGTVRSESFGTADNHDVISKQLQLQVLRPDDRVETRSMTFDGEQLTGRYQWENFYRVIRNNEVLKDEISSEMVAHSVQVITAMSEAARNGAQVFIPDLASSCRTNGRAVAVSV